MNKRDRKYLWNRMNTLIKDAENIKAWLLLKEPDYDEEPE